MISYRIVYYSLLTNEQTTNWFDGWKGHAKHNFHLSSHHLLFLNSILDWSKGAGDIKTPFSHRKLRSYSATSRFLSGA